MPSAKTVSYDAAVAAIVAKRQARKMRAAATTEQARQQAIENYRAARLATQVACAKIGSTAMHKVLAQCNALRGDEAYCLRLAGQVWRASKVTLHKESLERARKDIMERLQKLDRAREKQSGLSIADRAAAIMELKSGVQQAQRCACKLFRASINAYHNGGGVTYINDILGVFDSLDSASSVTFAAKARQNFAVACGYFNCLPNPTTGKIDVYGWRNPPLQVKKGGVFEENWPEGVPEALQKEKRAEAKKAADLFLGIPFYNISWQKPAKENPDPEEKALIGKIEKAFTKLTAIENFSEEYRQQAVNLIACLMPLLADKAAPAIMDRLESLLKESEQ